MSQEPDSRSGLTALSNRLPDLPGLGGAIAGLGGGGAMMVAAALLVAATGADIWQEPREIAAVALGGTAQGSGFDGAVLLGTVIHFVVSMLLGALFSIVSRRVLHLPSDYGVPTLAGLIYGLGIWAVAYFIVLPIVNPLLLDTYAPAFVIQHMVYGVVTGLLYTGLRPAPYDQGAPRVASAPR